MFFWRPKKNKVAKIEQEEQCKKVCLLVFMKTMDDDDWETMMQGSN